MRKVILTLAAVAISWLPLTATAQAMIESLMSAQPQMRMGKNGKIESCGMRISGFHDAGDRRYVFDTSIHISEEGYGLGKLSGMIGSVNNGIDHLKSAEVYEGWFRKQGGEPTLPLNSYIPGENPQTKLFLADSRPSLEVLDAIVNGLPIHISISWSKGNSIIYYGSAQLSEAEKDQFIGCLGDLVKQADAPQ